VNFTILWLRALESNGIFELACPVHLSSHRARKSGSKRKGKGVFDMTFTSIRETATIFAGAFISALLLVSAATSLPIA
jgi:hypothetical protein